MVAQNNMCTHLNCALDNEAVIGLKGALVGVLQVLLQCLLGLGIVVDVLEEGANELEAALQPEQRVGRKIVHIHIQHNQILQILVLQNIRTIGFRQFLKQKTKFITKILH